MKIRVGSDICKADIPALKKVITKLKTKDTVTLTLNYYDKIQEAIIKQRRLINYVF